MPVFLGLKLGALRGARPVRPYAAAAAGYFFYKETNVIGTASGGRLGLVAQAGLLVRLTGRVSLDLQGRYTMVKAPGKGEDAVATELGGFQGGLGIAFRF
jgi:outer membrane receptor protein involved in Fe transport